MTTSLSERSFHQHAAVDVEALAVDEAGGVRERAPSRLATFATARPMPDAAPVTTMT